MKKFIKGLFLCCLFLFLIGSGCVIAGLLMGITTDDLKVAAEKYLPFVDFEKQAILIEDEEIAFPDAVDGKEERNSIFGSDIEEEGDYVFQGEKVKEIELDVAGSNCNIYSTDSENIIIHLSGNSDMDVNLDEGHLDIEKDEKFFGNNENNIDIYLPVSLKLDEFYLQAGAGNINIEANIQAEKLVIQAGASAVNSIGKIQAGTLDIELGAGAVSLDYVDAQMIQIENGVGRTKLGLAGQKDQYNVTIDSAAGNVSYGGESISGVADSFERRPEGADYSIEIESALGEVVITFKEEI